MLRPAWWLLASVGLLSACMQTQGNAPPTFATVAPPGEQQQGLGAGPRHIALLLPLSGPNAAIAGELQQAAQLAASAPGAPPLDVRDTGGDPARAAQAAAAAIAAGDLMILGPLTAEETQAVASVAVPANIAVLSFSSDPSVAVPGVWTLGLTPDQQMRRLVAAARAEGRQHLAALLPDGAFGDALQTALTDAASQAGFEPPNIQRSDAAGADGALRTLTDYENRRGDLQSRISAMRQSTDPASRAQAAILAAQPVSPPPFDTLVLGANGDSLHRIAEKLPQYDVVGPQVRLLGPAFWAHGASRFHQLAGAWYALPDATQRSDFAATFQGKYGFPPQTIDDIAFDATLIGRSLAQDNNDFSTAALTKQDGFSGVDGALLLLPDGHVRRALAIYQVENSGGATIVSAAPTDLTAPGS